MNDTLLNEFIMKQDDRIRLLGIQSFIHQVNVESLSENDYARWESFLISYTDHLENDFQ